LNYPENYFFKIKITRKPVCNVSEGTANINKEWGTVVTERYGMCQKNEEGGWHSKI
jgi:hypothetical protein